MNEEQHTTKLDFHEVSTDLSDVNYSDIPAIIVFVILFFIVALQFFTRYVLNDSLGWTEEIARYFLIMLCFLGGINCVRLNKHIALVFIYKYLSIKLVKPLVLFSNAIEFIFFGLCTYLAIELAGKTRIDMVSISVPKAYLYYIVALGCLIMLAYVIYNIYLNIRKSPSDILDEKMHQQ